MSNPPLTREQRQIRIERAESVFDSLLAAGRLGNLDLNESPAIIEAAVGRRGNIEENVRIACINHLRAIDPENALELEIFHYSHEAMRSGTPISEDIVHEVRETYRNFGLDEAEGMLLTYILAQRSADNRDSSAASQAPQEVHPINEQNLDTRAREYLRLIRTSREVAIACLDVERLATQLNQLEANLSDLMSQHLSSRGITGEPTPAQLRNAERVVRQRPEFVRATTELQTALNARNILLRDLGFVDMDRMIISSGSMDVVTLANRVGNESAQLVLNSNSAILSLVAPLALFQEGRGFPTQVVQGSFEARLLAQSQVAIVGQIARNRSLLSQIITNETTRAYMLGNLVRLYRRIDGSDGNPPIVVGPPEQG